MLPASAALEHIPQKDRRLRSLDVFRGITIAGMILVNSPGNDTGYAFVRHSPWNGWTLADLIFPFFLFIMGVAIPFAFAKHLDREHSPAWLRRKIWRRSLILFALGLPGGFSLDPNGLFRIPGVLQRIGICYFAAARLYLRNSIKLLFFVTVFLLVGYWLVMTRLPVPGYGHGILTIQGNLASYLDRRLLGRHLYTDLHDPEGILSTFTAITTALMGVLAGIWLRSARTPQRKAAGMFLAGVLMALAGRIWGIWFPINKQIWTSSFSVFTGGIALCCLSACYYLIDFLGYARWGTPFEIFGVNAIASYCLAGLGYALLELSEKPRIPNMAKTFHVFLCQPLFGSWMTPQAASLCYSIAFMLLAMAVMSVLYRKKIYIKI